jgi:DNA (cytosine-5)-methyltransferase 1
MEGLAHKTLELKSFFRQFPAGKVPGEYYDHLNGQLTRAELLAGFPDEAEAAGTKRGGLNSGWCRRWKPVSHHQAVM